MFFEDEFKQRGWEIFWLSEKGYIVSRDGSSVLVTPDMLSYLPQRAHNARIPAVIMYRAYYGDAYSFELISGGQKLRFDSIKELLTALDASCNLMSQIRAVLKDAARD